MFCFGFDFISTKKPKQNQNLVIRNQNGEFKIKTLFYSCKKFKFWLEFLTFIYHAATPLGSFSALAMAAAHTLDFDV
jgi:hypothetical protein